MKKLSKQEQLALLGSPNGLERMKEYVSLTDAFMNAALQKTLEAHKKGFELLLSCIGELKDETEKEIYNNLSLKDAKELNNNGGPIYTEVWVKMLDVFKKEDVKEMLLCYCERAYVFEDTMLKLFEVYSKEDIRELLVAIGHMTVYVFGKALRIFTKEEMKALLIDIAQSRTGILDDESQLKILRVFNKKDAKDLLKVCIESHAGFCELAQLQIFDTFCKKDVKELLELAIESCEYISQTVLYKIMEFFGKREAKKLVESYFERTPARDEYEEDKRKFILAQL